MQGRGKREIPEKTRRPVSSSGTVPSCENPGATPPAFEPANSRLARKHLVNPITARCGATANEHTAEAPVCRGLRSLAFRSLNSRNFPIPSDSSDHWKVVRAREQREGPDNLTACIPCYLGQCLAGFDNVRNEGGRTVCGDAGNWRGARVATGYFPTRRAPDVSVSSLTQSRRECRAAQGTRWLSETVAGMKQLQGPVQSTRSNPGVENDRKMVPNINARRYLCVSTCAYVDASVLLAIVLSETHSLLFESRTAPDILDSDNAPVNVTTLETNKLHSMRRNRARCRVQESKGPGERAIVVTVRGFCGAENGASSVAVSLMPITAGWSFNSETAKLYMAPILWIQSPARLLSPLHTGASAVCSLAVTPHTGSYGIRKVFPCKSAIGSEACRACLINCDPIAKVTVDLVQQLPEWTMCDWAIAREILLQPILSWQRWGSRRAPMTTRVKRVIGSKSGSRDSFISSLQQNRQIRTNGTDLLAMKARLTRAAYIHHYNSINIVLVTVFPLTIFLLVLATPYTLTVLCNFGSNVNAIKVKPLSSYELVHERRIVFDRVFSEYPFALATLTGEVVNNIQVLMLRNMPVLTAKVEWGGVGLKGAGETGDLPENPMTNGIVRHDSHLRKSCDPAGD
ncbi:hypothetical protein PR048_003601 [Dryococelus australis]|uniref:Uncharacterized protein n=1 Tax=Dryococelus australis TaxID=614101 RepID=A0ABQ9INL5_9NEOP|nr:hypothetical protein PR048_003601 [Dryococelus australis]